MTNDLILQPESATETSQADHTANIKARDNHRSDKNSSKQQFQYNGSFREKEYLISQKKVGLNFHLPKFFVGSNFRHPWKILYLRADE